MVESEVQTLVWLTVKVVVKTTIENDVVVLVENTVSKVVDVTVEIRMDNDSVVEVFVTL